MLSKCISIHVFHDIINKHVVSPPPPHTRRTTPAACWNTDLDWHQCHLQLSHAELMTAAVNRQAHHRVVFSAAPWTLPSTRHTPSRYTAERGNHKGVKLQLAKWYHTGCTLCRVQRRRQAWGDDLSTKRTRFNRSRDTKHLAHKYQQKEEIQDQSGLIARIQSFTTLSVQTMRRDLLSEELFMLFGIGLTPSLIANAASRHPNWSRLAYPFFPDVSDSTGEECAREDKSAPANDTKFEQNNKKTWEDFHTSIFKSNSPDHPLDAWYIWCEMRQ